MDEEHPRDEPDDEEYADARRLAWVKKIRAENDLATNRTATPPPEDTEGKRA